MNSSKLSKLTSPHGEWLHDKKEDAWVYHVSTPHLLIQAAGYLKHVYGKGNARGIYFRGQSKLYASSLQPTLFRNVKTQRTRDKRIAALKKYIADFKKQGTILGNVPEYAQEPLLQHYGINTRWIDLVDNIWIALWFACHTAHSTGFRGEYLHFEQRISKVFERTKKKGEDPKKKVIDSKEYSYIVLIEVDLDQDKYTPGYFAGSNTELVDLRVAVPSTYIRPHAQHGLLAKLKRGNDLTIDYRKMIVGIIRVDLDDAIKWMGNGILLTPHVLFPSPVYDFGYRDLLSYAPTAPMPIGAIQHIGT